MKVLIFDWAWACPKELKTIGLEHQEVIDTDWDKLFKHMRNLVELNCCAMLKPKMKNIKTFDLIMYVDSAKGRFRQR